MPALVALETSTSPDISRIAFREHKTLHAKYEGIVERGYMDGIRRCFAYQRDVVGDGAGATTDPPAAKLRPLFEIVREGASKKGRRKLLENIVRSIDFDPAALEPAHAAYARFALDNLAALDYATADDVLAVVAALERLVAATGTAVAHPIEQHILHLTRPLAPPRLRALADASALLLMACAARNYLRKAYAVSDARAKKLRAADAALNKAPARNPGVSLPGALREIARWAGAGDDEDTCRTFAEVLAGAGAGAGADEDARASPESDALLKRRGSAEAERPAKRRKAGPKRRR